MKHKLFIIALLFIPWSIFGQSFLTLSGTVTDSKTGNKLDEINVVVEEINTGTITNYNGAFILYLTNGVYDITFSGDGYTDEKITVTLNENKEKTIELTPKTKTIKQEKIQKNRALKQIEQNGLNEILSHHSII